MGAVRCAKPEKRAAILALQKTKSAQRGQDVPVMDRKRSLRESTVITIYDQFTKILLLIVLLTVFVIWYALLAILPENSRLAKQIFYVLFGPEE